MLSIVIPFHNESENIPILIDKLVNVSKNDKFDHEIILVNDGSTDINKSNYELLITDYSKNRIKFISHKKRLGKGEALYNGVKNAGGEIIVFMDADLQDDPEDLPRFVSKLEEGYDFVNGVRVKRKENFLIRFYSSSAKYFLRLFLRSPYTDINCGFKAFKRSVLTNFTFYGNNFRFFPLAVYYNGCKVTEIPVKNNPRIYGKSKYGVEKVFAGLLDTLSAYFVYKFAERPLHFFGVIGGLFFTVGFIIALYLSFERIFYNVLLFNRPILLFAMVLILVGIQVVMTGFIGELIVFFNKQKK